MARGIDMDGVMQSHLLGAWRLEAAYFLIGETERRLELYGDSPRGSIVFLPSGRMLALLMSSERMAATDDAQKAALFDSMMSYGGTFTDDGEKFTATVELAWHPSWENTEQVRFYSIVDGKLLIRTAPNEHPAFPGETGIGYLEWTRAD